jgi:hypothetical protein
MLATQTFTIFQLIEKALWLLLSSLAIFTLCCSTEAPYKVINDFLTLFCAHVTHGASPIYVTETTSIEETDLIRWKIF